MYIAVYSWQTIIEADRQIAGGLFHEDAQGFQFARGAGFDFQRH